MVVYSRLRGLSICSGIGGIELGLEMVLPGFQTLCYVEREAFPASVLAKQMEEGRLAKAPIWSDVSTFDKGVFPCDVDIITAGYPCQPFSSAGCRRGADDPRHLWPQISRIIEEYQPKICLFENVRGHVKVGLKEVCEKIHSLGFDAEWDIFSAREEGAAHRRERLFILAYSQSAGRETCRRIRLRIAEGRAIRLAACKGSSLGSSGQAVSPVCGGGNVFSARLDRLRSLGNAVVPTMAARAFIELLERVDNGLGDAA